MSTEASISMEIDMKFYHSEFTHYLHLYITICYLKLHNIQREDVQSIRSWRRLKGRLIARYVFYHWQIDSVLFFLKAC